MAINEYSKNGKIYFRVYCQVLGKINKRLRLQKHLYKIETYAQAVKEEKKLIKSLSEELGRLEGQGLYWDEVILKWETAAKNGFLGDKCAAKDYYLSHTRCLRNYTNPWLNIVAANLTKGDGRTLINSLTQLNFSMSKIAKIRSSINLVYNWGIEEKFISAINSPVEGLSFPRNNNDVPKILTLDEVQKLMLEAKLRNHIWFQ